ncbi:MAG: hypothetical protein H0W15_07085 [Gemmatimonadales bacterium]|nr:hypothetical protein [Gemmatimonadales bacterium]
MPIRRSGRRFLILAAIAALLVVGFAATRADRVPVPELIRAAEPTWDREEELAPFANGMMRPLRDQDFRVLVAVPQIYASPDAELGQREFDLRDPAEWPLLREAIVRTANMAELQDDLDDAGRVRPFPFDVSSKGKRRALRETVTLIDRLGEGGGEASDTLHLLELVRSVQNAFRYPVPPTYQLVPDIFPKIVLQMRRHVEIGAEPAGTLQKPDVEPPASSFWRPGPDVGRIGMLPGFGRAEHTNYNDRDDCVYDQPKTGWGAHPGFDVRCGEELKFRFNLGDERYGGPFNTRIFDALGYHVQPIDAVAGLRLQYDRRVLSQYTSRRLLTMRAKFLFIPLLTRTITDIESPFDRIAYAVLRDGSHVAGRDLATRILRDTTVVDGQPRPEEVASNYIEEFERTIAYLVWQAGTAEPDRDIYDAIGAWDYDHLDHASRREVRGLFVLAAWLDQFNLRWENTRLAYHNNASGDRILVHLLSDVGSGLGLARDLTHNVNSDIGVMPWTVTERKEDGTVRFSGFASAVENSAFDGVTAGDARWMLRRIAAFSEAQLIAALVSTGMSAAEVRLALEKMLSKRQGMLRDFRLAGEFPDVMARVIDRQLDFDPRVPSHRAMVTAMGASGPIAPPVGTLALRAGELVPAR